MSTLNFELNAISINDLSIILPNSKGNGISIKYLFEQLNIYENIISPVIMGSILMVDTYGISTQLRTGSCYIEMDLSKGQKGEEKLQYKKTFRIYKQERRESKTINSELYLFYFCSEELIISEQTRVSRHYNNTYSEIATNILQKYLNVKTQEKELFISKTKGTKDIVIPALKPFDALYWCASRCVNRNNIPDILFFENKYGFNFISLDDLIKNKAVVLNFNAKNTAEDDDIGNFLGVKSSEIMSQFNLIESIKTGTYSGSVYGFDLITGSFTITPISSEYYSKNSLLNDELLIPSINSTNDGEAPDAKRTLLVTDSKYNQSNYAKKNSPNNNLHEPEFALAHKSAVFSFLNNKKMKLAVPGNFGLTIGMLVDLKYPKRGNITEKKQLDASFAGRHMILAIRHMVTPEIHETFLEISSNSDLSQEQG